MTAVDIFQYAGHEVRTVVIDGEPWFVATDIARVLDLGNVHSSLNLLDSDERGIHSVDTLGGYQSMATINESGLYSLILRSRKPEAKDFKRWITHDILPTIRKTGSYSPAPVAELDPTSLEGVQLILAAATTALAKVKELTPKADAWDELASATGDYEVGDAAKILARAGVETGRQRLFSQLEDLGWIYRAASGKWKARQTAVDSGYLAEKPQSHHHPRTGELVLDPPQVRVTVRGLERLRVRLGRLVALEVAS